MTIFYILKYMFSKYFHLHFIFRSLFSNFVIFNRDLPFFWCSLAGHLAHVWNMDAGIQLVHLALASLCPCQCASPCENHLFGKERNKETKKRTLISNYSWTMRKEENFGEAVAVGNHLHMLSCRTKLAMLLCLKNFGRISFANLCSSSTRKLFPSY